jgi:membrane-associated phospholipid phosphatase
MPSGFFEHISAFDNQPIIWLNQLIFKWPAVDLFLTWLATSHITRFIPMLLVVCWLWFERAPKQALNRQILVETVLAAFAALFIARFLALALPFRDRPLVNPELHLVIPFESGVRTWSSFPSDHAVLAFALATSLARLSPKIGLWAYFHAAIIICVPRLVFGLHYPSDLIGGALIGIAVALATAQFQRRHGFADLVLEIGHKHPAGFYAIAFLVLFEIGEMFDSIRGMAVYAFSILKHLLI